MDDLVRLGPEQRVDDVISAELNFAANTLEVEADGTVRITVVRRARPVNEGPDDVSASGSRAELMTLRFRAVPDTATGRLTTLVDLTGVSSWARSTHPARVALEVFEVLPGGPDPRYRSCVSYHPGMSSYATTAVERDARARLPGSGRQPPFWPSFPRASGRIAKTRMRRRINQAASSPSIREADS